MSLRLSASVICLLLLTSLFAQQSEERQSPVNIRSITLHEEGKAARSVDVESAPRDVAAAKSGALDGNWAITEDTGGGLSVENQPVVIMTSADGSITAAFPADAACPESSGARTHYFKGEIEGSTIIGTLDRCTGKAFVDKCGDADVYSIAFRADVRDADTIVGRYTATGYRIATGGCIEDTAYDREHTVTLRRIGGQSSDLKASNAGDSRLSQCRPIDLDRYCGETYGGGYSSLWLEPGSSEGSGWRCGRESTVNRGALERVSWTDACTSQYGALAEPERQSPGRNGMCCELLPSTPARVLVNRLNVYRNGDFFGKGDVKASFEVIHYSKNCDLEHGLNAKSCDGTAAWSGARQVKDNSAWDIRWETRAFDMMEHDFLQLVVRVVETDTISSDEICANGFSGYGSSSSAIYITPVSGAMISDAVWSFRTEYTPVNLEFYASGDISQRPGKISYRKVNPNTGIPANTVHPYVQPGGVDQRFALYCDDSQAVTEEHLWIGLDFLVYPDFLDRRVLSGSGGEAPDAPEPVSDDPLWPEED